MSRKVSVRRTDGWPSTATSWTPSPTPFSTPKSLNEKEIRGVVGLAEHPSQEDAEETITPTGTDQGVES